MARLVQGILGGIRGKIGNVVGSAWKGIAVIKTKPLSVANPQTAAQVAQREKFANAVAFAKEILAVVIKPLWDRFATRMSGYNEFISDNLSLFAAAKPSPAADLVIGKGKMASTAIATLVVADGSGLVTLTWVDDTGVGFKLATDLCYFIAWRDDADEIAIATPSATRDDETKAAGFTAVLSSGDTVHAYMCFKRADGTVVSDTSYKTAVVA